MIKEIRKLRAKYEDMQKKKFTTVFISEVINDLFQLEGEARIRRLPKDER